MARRRRPTRTDHFTWKPEDIHITYPDSSKVVDGLSDELHTILWSLEHVSNRAQMHEVMGNVAMYLIDHPGDPLVAAAVTRVEQRLEYAT